MTALQAIAASAARVSDRPAAPRPQGLVYGANPARYRLSALESAFLPTGGILSGDCVSQLMRDGFEQPISMLARWIVGRDVVSFELQGQIWLPMFQFDPSDMQVRPGVRKVIHELRGVFDEWELAEWFAHPNSSLCGQAPASEVLRNERAVLEAAMVDRYVAAG